MAEQSVRTRVDEYFPGRASTVSFSPVNAILFRPTPQSHRLPEAALAR